MGNFFRHVFFCFFFLPFFCFRKKAGVFCRIHVLYIHTHTDTEELFLINVRYIKYDFRENRIFYLLYTLVKQGHHVQKIMTMT